MLSTLLRLARPRVRHVSPVAPYVRCGFHSTLNPGANTNTREEDGKPQSATGKRAISLLEELFGTSTQRGSSKKAKVKLAREIPKIALEHIVPTDEQLSHENQERQPKITLFDRQRHNRSVAVLVLRKASKFLIESDFRRAIPSSRHIEGWARTGDILRVIRGRDASTLEPDGSYYLLFENASSAQSYRTHVLALHRTSRTFLPAADPLSAATAGRTIPIPPPPILDPATNKLSYGPNEGYTLLLPSHDVDLSLSLQPFSPLLRQVIDHLGYAPLVEERRSDYEVLMSVDWGYVGITQLSRAVASDGKLRGLHWAMISNRTGIREVNVQLEGIKNVASLPESAAGKVWKPTTEDTDAREELKSTWRPPREDSKRRFIVSFREDAEAKRFVLAWHKRDISDLLERVPDWRETVITEAELIW